MIVGLPVVPDAYWVSFVGLNHLGWFLFHQNFRKFRNGGKFLGKVSRKSGNSGISEKQTIQTKITGGKSNGT